MNEAQQEDLFIEWSLYEDLARKAMVDEYQQLRKSQKCEDSFLDFLSDNCSEKYQFDRDLPREDDS